MAKYMLPGTGLSKGYLNRDDLTAERFIQNPYIPNEILYKSGDVARWIYDGTLEYMDRFDNQVQIRGFRVGNARNRTAAPFMQRNNR